MSKKRVIAVDFDDVVIQTGINFIEYSGRTYGKTIHPKHLYKTTHEAWGVDSVEFEKRVINFHTTEQRDNIQFVEGAIQTLSKLSTVAELHIVTGRPPSLTTITGEILDTYLPNVFKSVNFTNVFSKIPTSKSTICLELGIDLLIDDHFGHAQDVAGHGIDVLLFGNHPWNQADVLPKGVRRVGGWDEVLKIVDAEDSRSWK